MTQCVRKLQMLQNMEGGMHGLGECLFKWYEHEFRKN